MMKLAVAMAFLLAGTPAWATSVADVLRAHTVMHALDALTPDAYLSYRTAHAAELLAATAVLEDANTTYDAVLETTQAAFERYGVKLMCNFDEDDAPTEAEMFDAYVTWASQAKGFDPAVARVRLVQVDYREMVSRALLALYPCPSPQR